MRNDVVGLGVFLMIIAGGMYAVGASMVQQSVSHYEGFFVEGDIITDQETYDAGVAIGGFGISMNGIEWKKGICGICPAT